MLTRSQAMAVASLVLATAPATARAQALASRVDGAPAGHVQFTFAARPGVCGNGKTYYSTAPGNFNGSFSTSVYETVRADPCEPGPVRVVIDRADREIIKIQTYVGPPAPASGVADLGRVSGQQAVDYLLGLAAKAEGRVGRDAIVPATLADSATTMEGLVAIARNQALPRETRSQALSYVGRSGDRMPTIPPRVVETLVGVARDETDNINVRKSALSTLQSLDHGAGIPSLIDMARQTTSLTLSRDAMTALSSSGDPRARAYLRTAVQREDLSDEAISIAINALGQQYSTREDAALLRTVYPRLRSERTRDAVLSAVASVGGTDNVRWLLDLGKNESETADRRRKAIDAAARAGAPVADLVRMYDVSSDRVKDALISSFSRSGERGALDKLLLISRSDTENPDRRRIAIDAASRAGAPIAELIRLYDASGGDQKVKTALVSAYQRSGDRTAVDKLISIAKTETNINVRRQAITALSSSDDPRVKEALKDLIIR